MATLETEKNQKKKIELPYMPNVDPEEKKRYQKRIDELIEDAEIEAEMEREKKIRSKNTRLLTISGVSIALLVFIFMQLNNSGQAPSSPELGETPLAGVAEKLREQQGPEPEAPAQKSAEPPAAQAPAPKPAEPETAQAPGGAANGSAPVPEPPASEPSQPSTPQPEPVQTSEPPKPPAEPPQTVAQAQPKSKPAAAAPASPASGEGYGVQLGVFAVKENADNFIQRLKAKGFDPRMEIRNIDARRTVVYVGRFPDQESSQTQFQELQSKGFNPVRKQNEDGTYTFVMGRFKSQKEADNLQDKLSLSGFLSSSRTENIASTLHTVVVGNYSSLAQARQGKKKLTQAGFKNGFIRK